MTEKIKIVMGGEEFPAVLYDNPAGRLFSEALPLTVALSAWGNEFYGDCELELHLDETAKEIMEVGELAFWPPGSAFCLFFGPTPASTDERPVAASAVAPLGKLTGNIEKLSGIKSAFGGRVEAVIEKV